jgi:hypothetical protein
MKEIIMILSKRPKFRTAEMRAALQRKQYRRFAEVGAVSTMDLMLWAAGILAAMAFLLWVKNSGWPLMQGWMEASAVTSNMQKINGIYNGAANFTGLTTASVANNNIFAVKYLPGGGVILNRFGGNVTVAPLTTNSTNDTLRYQETLVNSAACPTMANQLADDVDIITIQGVVVKANGAAINPTTLNTQCNAATQVTIISDKIKQS